MNIKYLKQLNKEELLGKKYDLIITSSGYEIRATEISRYIKSKSLNKKVFSFSDHKNEPSRVDNDKFFKQNGFKNYELNGDDNKAVYSILDEYMESNDLKKLSILVDYSSMTRIWYGSIIKYFKELKTDCVINIFFSYSESIFIKPIEKDSKTSNFEPIRGYCNLSIPLYPTALITGLGYERNKAFGLKEFFDAEQLFLFYTKENEYTKEVLKINEKLIKRTSPDNIIPYKINDMLLTKKILYELISSLKDSYRIIIAPLGPKPFTLISFLVADELKYIDVWRISSNDISKNKLCEPNGSIVTLEICYE